MSTQKQKIFDQVLNDVVLKFTSQGWEDFNYWIEADNDKYKKITNLIEECRRNPFEGTGKPKTLTGPLKGLCSRRIDITNRLVYLFKNNELTIVSCRYHYDDK